MHPEQCRKSRGCVGDGLCTLKGDSCIAASDDDCAESFSCRRNRQCTAKDGACVADDLPKGNVSITKLKVRGKISRDDVAEVIRKKLRTFDRCYSKAQAADSKARGSVEIRLAIGRDGRVSNVGGGGSGPPEATSCCTRACHGLEFAPPNSGVATASFTLKMTP